MHNEVAEEDGTVRQAAAAWQEHLVSSMLLGEKIVWVLLMCMQVGLMQPPIGRSLSKQGRLFHWDFTVLAPLNRPLGRLHRRIIHSGMSANKFTVYLVIIWLKSKNV